MSDIVFSPDQKIETTVRWLGAIEVPYEEPARKTRIDEIKAELQAQFPTAEVLTSWWGFSRANGDHASYVHIEMRFIHTLGQIASIKP